MHKELTTNRKVLFYSILIIINLIIIFILCELAARAIEYRVVNLDKEGVMIENINGTGSYRLKRNLRLAYKVNEVSYKFITNSFGMAWHAVDKKKHAKVQRIAVLGDSFTRGAHTDSIDNTYVGVFSNLLNKNNYEVLNFGVSGYGIDDMELYLKEEIIEFKPDYVVLAIFNGNDFRDTYLGLNKTVIKNGLGDWNWDVMEEKLPEQYRNNRPTPKKPEKPEKPEKIEPNETGERPVSFKIILNKYLAIGRLIYSQFDDTNRDDKKIEECHNDIYPADFVVWDKFTSYSFWSNQKIPSISNEAKVVTLDTIRRIKRFLDSNDIELFIMSIPYMEQVYAKEESGIDIKGSAYDTKLPQLWIETLASELNVPYHDLLPILRKKLIAKFEPIYLCKDSHFNNLGHKITGDSLYSFFEQHK